MTSIRATWRCICASRMLLLAVQMATSKWQVQIMDVRCVAALHADGKRRHQGLRTRGKCHSEYCYEPTGASQSISIKHSRVVLFAIARNPQLGGYNDSCPAVGLHGYMCVCGALLTTTMATNPPRPPPLAATRPQATLPPAAHSPPAPAAAYPPQSTVPDRPPPLPLPLPPPPGDL